MTLHFDDINDLPPEHRQQAQEALKQAASSVYPVKPMEDTTAQNKSQETQNKRSKYGNKRTMYNGVMYASRGEAGYAQGLDLEMRIGTVLWWSRQPRFVLEGGVEYVADFIVQRPDGVEIIDWKGHKTSDYRIKKKQVEARYKVKIMEVV